MSDPAQGPYGLPPTGQPAPMQEGEFTPASRNRDVFFATCDIDPPSPAYIDVDDTFVMGALIIRNSLNVLVNLRILRPNGRIETVSIPFSAGGGGIVSTATRNEREGYILSAQIHMTSNPGQNGVYYVWLAIQRGGSAAGNQYRLLIADYVTPSIGASWPDRPTQRAAAGPGVYNTLSVGNPAAGSDWTFTAGPQERAQIILVSAQLAAANAGSARTVSLQITDGTHTMALIDSPNTQAINTTVQYTGYGGAFIGGVAGLHLYWPLPAPLFLGNSWTLGTITAGIQAADQWSNIRLAALEWVDYF